MIPPFQTIINAPTIYYAVGGIGTFIAAIVSAIVIIRKMGPEVSQIQIQSAQDLVEMAKTSASMSAETAKDLRERGMAQDDRITELARKVGEYEARIRELEEKAGLVDRLREEVEHERTEKERLARENLILVRRVDHLEHELATLHGETLTDPTLPDTNTD